MCWLPHAYLVAAHEYAYSITVCMLWHCFLWKFHRILSIIWIVLLMLGYKCVNNYMNFYEIMNIWNYGLFLYQLLIFCWCLHSLTVKLKGYWKHRCLSTLQSLKRAFAACGTWEVHMGFLCGITIKRFRKHNICELWLLVVSCTDAQNLTSWPLLNPASEQELNFQVFQPLDLLSHLRLYLKTKLADDDSLSIPIKIGLCEFKRMRYGVQKVKGHEVIKSV